jgi:DNA-binding transcriptional LysR family regulator
MRARVIPGNVHDSIMMPVNGNSELMFAYHHSELPLHLDPTRYEDPTVGADTFMPVCMSNQRSAPASGWPARTTVLYRLSPTRRPVISDAASQSCSPMRTRLPPCGFLHYESDMAEVVKNSVLEGEGLAWLPRSSIVAGLDAGDLVPTGTAGWRLEVELRVYGDA